MIKLAFIYFQCSLCENSFCQQANLERHVKRHQQKYLQNVEGTNARDTAGGSPGSASILSQNESMLRETFSEEDEDDEIVDLETISAD